MLAEAVSINGGALVIVLVILVLLGALAIAAMVLGCVWATRAGRGSRRALAGWLVVAVLEAVYSLPLIAGSVRGRRVSLLSLIVLAVLGAQVVLFTRARTRSSSPETKAREPPVPPPPPRS